MNIYVPEIVETYKHRIIGHLENIGAEDLLSHIVQSWRVFAVDKKIYIYL